MKKCFLFAAAMLVSGSLMAQLSWNPQPSSDTRIVGITVGYVQKTMTGKGLNNKTIGLGKTKDGDNGSSLRVGLVYNPEFMYGIGMMVGLNYEWTPSFDNQSSSVLGHDLKVEYSTHVHELSLPIRFSWRYELIDDLSVFAYTGPSLDLGLDYNNKVACFYDGELQGTYTTHSYSGNWKRSTAGTVNEAFVTALGGSADAKGNNNNLKEYNRFHAYWGFGIGVQWKGLRLSYEGDWGLHNINLLSSKADDFIRMDRPVSINLSYLFSVE